MMENFKLHLLELLLRCFAGLLFFAPGYDKLFRLGIPGVVKSFQSEAESRHIPSFFLWSIAIYTAVVEFGCGLLLIGGLFQPWVLLLLGMDLLLVAFAISLMKPLWDMRHVLPRLIFVLLLLAIPSAWSAWSLDHLIFTK